MYYLFLLKIKFVRNGLCNVITVIQDDLLDTYYKTAIKGLRKTDSLDFADFYLDVCNSGENRFYQKNITETKFFDEVWVKTLESFFPSIDKIIITIAIVNVPNSPQPPNAGKVVEIILLKIYTI